MSKHKKIEVVIDRSKWRTGRESAKQTCNGVTQLLNKEGSMCCLGFITSCYLKSKRKASKNPILGAYSPGELNFLVPELTVEDEIDGLLETPLCHKAIEINDSTKWEPETKEKKIKELFKNSQYKLKFIGKFNRPEVN